MQEFLHLSNNGLRGIIGSGLDMRKIINYTASLSSYHNDLPLFIARDTRKSSKMLYHATLSTAISMGKTIYNLGILPAPLLRYAIYKHKNALGCLIGAGNHSSGWNCLLPINEKGSNFNPTEGQALLDIYHARSFEYKKWDKLGKELLLEEDIINSYIQYIAKNKNIELIRQQNFTLIADLCNGSATKTLEELCKFFNIKLIAINNISSGYLSHDPEPRPRNAYQVQALMNSLNADLGIVCNSDASLFSLVSSEGEMLSEEYSFAIIANEILQKNQTIVTNNCTSLSIDKIVAKKQANLIKCHVDEASMINTLHENDAILAGNGIGGVIFNNNINGSDSFNSLMTIFNVMAEKQTSSTSLAKNFKRFFIRKKNIMCPPSKGYMILELINETIQDAKIIDAFDGYRFNWEEGWVHLRYSNTQPCLRLICEWQTEEGVETKIQLINNMIQNLL